MSNSKNRKMRKEVISMFCTKCGAQNRDGSAFCIQCGTPLQNIPQQVPVQQAPVQQAPVQQNSYYTNAGYNPTYPTQVMTTPIKKPNYTLIGIISIAAVAIIIVVVVLLLVGGKSSIVGTWSASDYGLDATLTFKANGIVETDSFGSIETARYKTSGDTLTITTEDGEVEKGHFKITKRGGKTQLELTFEGETLVFIKK